MLTLVMAISIIAISPTASGATIYKANNFEYIKLGGNKARVTAILAKIQQLLYQVNWTTIQ